MDGYLSRKEACKSLQIHYHTLYKLASNKEIEVIKIGCKQFFNIKKYLLNKGINNTVNNNINNIIKKNICYCRVSSNKQKEDLNRQIAKKNKFFFAICAKIKNL
jgi:excisionase family DNA binding protein